MLLNHRSGLVDQLSVSLDAALTLHLACLVLFQAVTGHLLHASGKFVPQIISFLKPHLSFDFFNLLHEYQGKQRAFIEELLYLLKCDGQSAHVPLFDYKIEF